MIKNSSLGMQFRTCKKFWESTDSKSSFIPKFFTNTKATPQILELDSNVNSAESSLRGESMDSPKQSKQNNLHEVQTESRPIRGAKNRNQTSSSASADFLLELEKRGSPPKSEKWQLLARRGSGAGGAALLRKETSDSISKKIANDSRITKMDCHESQGNSRNDKKKTDFANQAQKNNRRDCGGGFVFARIFGIETRLGVCEIPKILTSAKDARISELPRNGIYLQIPRESTAFKANLI